MPVLQPALGGLQLAIKLGGDMLYSKNTGGFYYTDIHGSNIPADAVEISDEIYEQLLAAQNDGAHIIAGSSGMPTAVPSRADLASEIAIAMSVAGQQVAVLQDAVDLGMAAKKEADLCTEWRRYRVLLSRLQSDPAYPDVRLPVQPERVVP